MKLLTKKAVCEKVGFCPSHIDRFRFDPAYAHLEFPKAIKIGFKVLWCEKEIDDWIQAQLDRRHTTP